ncbi:MAG TPA: penicillin acylase family protein [Bryobacteraceae bacterium]|jgi:penicillin amidase
MRAVLFHTPLLRAINLSIAVLLVLVLAIVYWFGWRSLPQTSGSITAPIGGPSTIARDSRGVPHITAASWEDAIFLQGYVMAQDRLWQMDALRRLAAGELAEVVGKAALESDQDSHRWRMQRVAEDQERRLTPGSRAILAAYARGVNYFLETHRGRLPPEFTVLRYDPRPWSVRDSLLIILQMYRMLASSWREELNKSQMLAGGDAAKVNFLYPQRTGSEVQPGSNAWVISGAHSATGKPILANDPHLDWAVPSEWYLVHLKAPDLDVTGATLPGFPGIITGHNRRIAWGLTNLGFDVQDLYREQINLENGRYLYQGRIEQARLERDIIAVKGQAPIEFTVWVTRHGPVFLDDGNIHYSMRWIAADDQPVQFPGLDLDRAQNWEEFNAALKDFAGPAQNFVYADVDGNIGYHAAGRLPEREKACPADLPLDGTSGECEWHGVIPFEDLPHVYNPPSGTIVTANQNPFPTDYPWPVDGRFASTYRVKQIAARLGSREKWQPADMLTVQKDVYSELAHFLAGQMAAAFDKKSAAKADTGGAQVRAAVDILRSWNGQMEKGTAAPLLASLAYDRLRNAVANRASPGHSANYETSFLAPEIVERLLRERPPGWFPDYDALLLKSLQEAIADGGKLQGSRISRWDYGQYNQLKIENPIFGALPVIGKYFDIGPAPMSGSATTVKQTTRRLGPSMRMIVDLSNLDRSLINVTTGESGHELSRHYMDQWDAYYAGQSFPMEFDQVRASEVLTVNP